MSVRLSPSSCHGQAFSAPGAGCVPAFPAPPTPRYLLLLLLHQLFIGSEHLSHAAPQQLLQRHLGQGVTTNPVQLLAQAEQEALHVPRGLGRRTEFICSCSGNSIPFHIPSGGCWECPTLSAATKLCPIAWLRRLTGSGLLTPQILGYSSSQKDFSRH